jgi:hypothetical protein
LEASSSASTEDPISPEWVHKPALLYAIRDEPGTPEDKARFVDDELGLMGLEVMKDSNLRTNANKAAALGALTIRYYRAHRNGSRPGQQAKATAHGNEGVREREAREVEEFIDQHAEGGDP